MILNNVSVRRITAITAMTVVVIFVACYLGFKYFWTYDRSVKQALELQQEEVERVETITEFSKHKLRDLIVDYASWDDMVDFVQHPTQEFVDSSIGVHAFTSQFINGFFIFSPDKRLVWGKVLDELDYMWGVGKVR